MELPGQALTELLAASLDGNAASPALQPSKANATVGVTAPFGAAREWQRSPTAGFKGVPSPCAADSRGMR
jgi:hypothetical protein